jgi:glycosyltransferase involved in cell wall biosynthesis
MRILVGTWGARAVGGTETYLGRVMAQLDHLGHEIGFCYEVDGPDNRQPIAIPAGAAVFPMNRDRDASLSAIRVWEPDVSYLHGLLDAVTEARLLDVAPAVFFAHGYYGTCISGDKTHKLPIIQPCHRSFGAACLALYFPRRCGGLSPIEMLRLYGRQRRRLDLLRRYSAVVTFSEHMRQEFLSHGAAEGRVYRLPSDTPSGDVGQADLAAGPRQPERWQLVFAGRMDRLKGGGHLIDALPRVLGALDRPLRVVFVGDGPRRREWEERAGNVVRRSTGIDVAFTGWLEPGALAAVLDATDVTVMPSLWPEPFGLVGPESNRRGIPVVAYAAGGIPEWLEEGINGCLAPSDPPTVEGLARAIVRCLSSLAVSGGLRVGALRKQSTANVGHVEALVRILSGAAAGAGRNIA